MKWIVSMPVSIWPYVKKGAEQLLAELSRACIGFDAAAERVVEEVMVEKFGERGREIAREAHRDAAKRQAEREAAQQNGLHTALEAMRVERDRAFVVIEDDALEMLTKALDKARRAAPIRFADWFRTAEDKLWAGMDEVEDPVDAIKLLDYDGGRTDTEGRVKLNL